MKRSTAIYHAKEAYKTWLYNGRKVAGFTHAIPNEEFAYVYTIEDYIVFLRSNGALHKCRKV